MHGAHLQKRWPDFRGLQGDAGHLGTDVKRLTADETEFCGGVVVLAAGENVGESVIVGKELLRLSGQLEPLDT